MKYVNLKEIGERLQKIHSLFKIFSGFSGVCNTINLNVEMYDHILRFGLSNTHYLVM